MRTLRQYHLHACVDGLIKADSCMCSCSVLCRPNAIFKGLSCKAWNQQGH